LFDLSRGYLVHNSIVVEVELTCNVDEKNTVEHLRVSRNKPKSNQ
jgi:hypothetical protein